MSPAVKYTLGRIGLFVAVLLVVWPAPLDLFLKLLVALVVSFALSWFLLRSWRDQMSMSLVETVERRRAAKQRLRAALAGEDDGDPAPDDAGRDRDAGRDGDRD
jgi:hypothetical protein